MAVYVETSDPSLLGRQTELQKRITEAADELCKGQDGKVIASIAYNACVNMIVDIFLQAPEEAKAAIVMRFLSVLQANGADIVMGAATLLDLIQTSETKH